MKFIIKLHPEITIKSDSVRKRFSKLLTANIRHILRCHELKAVVENRWDRLEVVLRPQQSEDIQAAITLLQKIPGIEQIHQVKESEFTDLDDIYQQVKAVWENKLQHKTFAVRVKRKGKHDFSSTEVAAYVGGGLNQHCETGGVKLKKPDVTIQFDVHDNTLRMLDRKYPGLGGMPLPTQEDVLSLISGGFDSAVASYQLIRRGARTHFLFFNLGGRDHEIGVRALCHYLWKTFSLSHRVKFIAVDFAPVVAEILEKVDDAQMGVILKRMMLRAAEQVANNLGINALVTGEAIGQVSSQTTTNLHVIDQVTNKLVFRPLICSDKSEIIDIARQIGTEDFAKSMPEYCGVISRKPTVKANLNKIETEEANFDFSILEQVVTQAKVEDIRAILDDAEQQIDAIEMVSELAQSDIVLDIRSPEEEERKPLELIGIGTEHIPFYRLATKFAELDQNKTYFLYCDRGVMSQMQALLLKEHGYKNVKVYRP